VSISAASPALDKTNAAYNLTCRLLSGVTITSFANLADAISVIHRTLKVPHVIVTSIHLPGVISSSSSAVSFSTADQSSGSQDSSPSMLAVVGSTMRSDGTPRLFKVDVPHIDCFFSGTGDMFAALTVARLREAVLVTDASQTSGSATRLCDRPSWVSPDDVQATDLPLAHAAEKVLASMHCVLEKTAEARSAELAKYSSAGDDSATVFADLPADERKAALEKRAYLRQTKAAEIRLVRNVDLLKYPTVEFKAVEFAT
jgi:pyridoxine kinase